MKDIKWLATPADESLVQSYMSAKYHPVLARLLASRGIPIDEARSFLNPVVEELIDPLLMKGMQTAIGHIRGALERLERVAIWCDYDVDGVTSCAIMLKTFRSLGMEDVIFHVPSRFDEGYGLNEQGIRQLAEQGVDLLITIDCGITAVHEVAIAKALGMKVIIADHHHVPEELPAADAIIDPHQPGETYPFHDLCAAGIAFKIAHALSGRPIEEYLELAALGTIADLVPLVGENRIIAYLGLQRMSACPSPAMEMLLRSAGIQKEKKVTAGHVGFQVGPRINALGRLGSAEPGVELFTTEDMQKMSEIVSHMDTQNALRQRLCDEVTEACIEQIESHPEWLEEHILLLSGEGFYEGVIGIAASRIVERYQRPTLVISVEGEHAKGSARSISGIDLFSVLNQATVWSRFGGHEMAAGFSLASKDIEKLRVQLQGLTKDLPEEVFQKKAYCDAPVEPSELTVDLVEQLDRLEPYGLGNPSPRLFLKNLYVKSIQRIGKDEAHLKIRLIKDGCQLELMGFRQAEEYEDWIHASRTAQAVHVAGQVAVNRWRDKETIQVILHSWR